METYKMNESKFRRWVEGEVKKDGMTPNLDPQDALHIIVNHLLGEDWYIFDPVGGLQANTIIVETIMKNYPTSKLDIMFDKVKKTIKLWKTK